MRNLSAGLLALALLLSLLPAPPARAATPAPKPPAGSGAKDRNDYANALFTTPLAAGLKHFYGRSFKEAQADFERALAVIPDNTLAIFFLNASAAQQTGELDVLTNIEEDAVGGAPKSYVNHVRLGVTYLFAVVRDRTLDAREELTNAINLNPDGQAAHVSMGVLRYNERSANRAKTEMLAALKADPNNVLAREYLAEIYQIDLRDPQRGMSYAIDVPNLVPGYADIEFHIGSILHDLKQPDAAIAALRRGIDLDTSGVGEAGQHGYTLIARIDIEQHKFPDAEKMLNTAIQKNADAIYAKKLLEKLKNGDYGTPAPNPVATAKRS
jgi:Tfp pilus assembly protein PilF